MSADFEIQAAALERLSALVDGELDADATTQACALWRANPASRASWHTYQLIGDVLRSDDLAGDPVRDARFLDTLRARLAAEPVALAPQPLAWQTVEVAPSLRVANGAPSRRWMWLAPSAVAAGFMAIAGALLLARAPDSGPESQPGVPMASAVPVDAAAASTRAAPGVGGEPQALVAGGALIRDARLDSYLAAHKQFAGTSALGVPSAFLRSATVRSSDR